MVVAREGVHRPSPSRGRLAPVPSDALRIMVNMNRLSTEKRAAIIGCLVEGNSIRATVRITGRRRTRSRDCWSISARPARSTSTRRWAGCRAERSSATRLGVLLREAEERPGAVQRHARLRRRVDMDGALRGHEARPVVACRRAHHRGRDDVRARPSRPACGAARADHDRRPAAYREAIGDAFRGSADHAMLHKVYGLDPKVRGAQRRYSPPIGHQHPRHRRLRRPRPRRDQHELRRAAEPHDADGHAALHAPHERVLEEGREPRARRRAALHALQLRARPPDAQMHAGAGRRRHRQALDADATSRRCSTELRQSVSYGDYLPEWRAGRAKVWSRKALRLATSFLVSLSRRRSRSR